MKFTLLIIFCLFFSSCNKTTSRSKYIHVVKQDTIFAPKTNRINRDCKKNEIGYTNKLGIVISNFFKPDEQIMAGDDSVAILKPYYSFTEFSACASTDFGGNLLIIFNQKDKRTKVYNNILFSDNRNVFQELKPNGNGFIIYAEQGNSSKFFSNIFVSKNKIDSIQIESWGFDQYSKTYKFKNFDLTKFRQKFIDSLQQEQDR